MGHGALSGQCYLDLLSCHAPLHARGVIPLVPFSLRGVGCTNGVIAAVAGPLWNWVGGADSGAGAVEPPTGVTVPEVTIAGS